MSDRGPATPPEVPLHDEALLPVPVRGSLVQALDEFLLTPIPLLDRFPGA